MGYCIKCGKELPEGARFCGFCGAEVICKSNEREEEEKEPPKKTYRCPSCNGPLSKLVPICPYCHNATGIIPNASYEHDDAIRHRISEPAERRDLSVRRTVYEGKIHRCPHCNETLPSFVTVCPSCNGEIRGGNIADSIENFFGSISIIYNEQEKIQLIKTFPIPNSKEDILEFMIMASTNFDADYYASHIGVDDISDAWFAKIEQCYKKARIVLKESELEQIEETYQKIVASIESGKKKFAKESRRKAAGKAFASLGEFITDNWKIILGGIVALAVIVGVVLFFVFADTSMIFITVGELLGAIGSLAVIILIIVLIAKGISNSRQSNSSSSYTDYKYKSNYSNSSSVKTNSTAKSNSSSKKSGGWHSWNGFAKLCWVVLNIYMMGIPAIIYYFARR